MANWITSGNSLTAPPNDYLGTTDNEPLVIKTAGIERMRISASGQVGIGTSNLEATLTTMGPRLAPIRAAEAALASLGFLSGNYSRLAIVADRSSDGDDWTTSSIGLRMDVDLSKNVGGSVFLAANGNVGINTSSPDSSLSVQGKSLDNREGAEIGLASLGFFPGAENYSRLSIVAQRIAPGDGWASAAIGLQMDVDITRRAGAHVWLHPSGNVGIGTSDPEANLSVYGDNLGTAAGSELRLASFGFSSGNFSRLGVYARRFATGNDWATTAVGLGMDVDISKRVGGAIWLDANGGVGIGTEAQSYASFPNTRLSVIGQLQDHRFPFHAMALADVQAAAVVGESRFGTGVVGYTRDDYFPGIYGFTFGAGSGVTGFGRGDVDGAIVNRACGVYGSLQNDMNSGIIGLPPPCTSLGGGGRHWPGRPRCGGGRNIIWDRHRK